MPEPDVYEGTVLEAHVHALAACVVAWGFPGDTYVRAAAITNCGTIGIDYIAVLAGVIENTIPETTPIDAAMTTARWSVVDHIANCIHALRNQGASPREHVLASGEPCNARGTRLNDDEGDTYA
jgi:hypothetical protein